MDKKRDVKQLVMGRGGPLRSGLEAVDVVQAGVRGLFREDGCSGWSTHPDQKSTEVTLDLAWSHLRLGAYNDETLIEFLTDLHELEKQRAVVLIWDGLPSHRSRRMSGWITSQRQGLSVEPLPGYAPDLTPIEQVWGSVKFKELANLCSDTIGEVAAIAEAGLDRIGSDAPLCFAFLRHTGLRL